MIQHVGGGRVVDHGPQKPYSGSRSVIGGQSLATAVVTANRSMFSYDVARAKVRKPRPRTTPTRSRDRWKAWQLLHANCACHIMYGGEPRRAATIENYLAKRKERRRLEAARKAEA